MTRDHPHKTDTTGWLVGTAEMATRIRALDWSATPLGPIDGWPQSLKTAVDIMIASGHAMQLAWGPERIVLYNDAYAPMLADHHPGALGLPLREAQPDIWDEIEPLVASVFAGDTVRFENMPLGMTRRGYHEDTWWTFSYSPVRGETGEIAGLLNVTVDATASVRAERAEQERDAANALIKQSEARLRALVNASSDVVYSMNPHWTEMRRLAGRGFLADTEAPSADWIDAYIFPEDRARVRSAIDEAIHTKRVFELEHRVRRRDGTAGWTFSRAIPVSSAAGEVVEWFGMAADVTDRKTTDAALRESEERLQMVVAELQHRTRNLMGVVRSVSDATVRSSVDLEDFEGKFRDRLGALARTQSLLSRLAESDRITFDELLRTELTAHGALGQEERRVTLRGPARVPLRSSTVQTLAMALHELSTNAIKHGALGAPRGRLHVEWRLEPARDGAAPLLRIDWRERGVTMPPPEAARPLGSGQGRELIEKALPYQLKAKTSFTLEADGLHCTIVMPVSERAMKVD